MTQTQSLRDRLCIEWTRLVLPIDARNRRTHLDALESIVRSERAAERERCRAEIKSWCQYHFSQDDLNGLDARIAALEDEP